MCLRGTVFAQHGAELDRPFCGRQDGRETSGLVYTRTTVNQGRELRLDIYKPYINTSEISTSSSSIYENVSASSSTPVGPALLYFHPGGFLGGNFRRSLCHNAGCSATAVDALRRLGVTVVSVEYKLCHESGSRGFPYADAVAAFRFVAETAESHGIDASRIGCIGYSAGGGLCAYLAQSGVNVQVRNVERNSSQMVSIRLGISVIGWIDMLLQAAYSYQKMESSVVPEDAPRRVVQGGIPPLYDMCQGGIPACLTEGRDRNRTVATQRIGNVFAGRFWQ